MSDRRVVWSAQRTAGLEDFEPGPVGPRDVAVSAELSLVSPGTERAHLLALPNTPQRFPLYPGYSMVGSVLAVGSEVSGLEPGDRVFCYGPHWSTVTVPSAMAVPVPDGVDPHGAGFTSLSTISLQGIRKAGVEIGSRVAVLGTGLIGLFAVEWARVAGADEVWVVEPVADRHPLATAAGATRVFGSWQEVAAAGLAPEVVVDCTGAGDAIVGALEICARRGTVVVLGSPRGQAESVDFYRTVHLKGLTVVGAHDYVRPEVDRAFGYWTWADDAAVALRYLRSARIDVGMITSTDYPVSDVVRMYDDLLAGTISMAAFIDWRE